MRNWKEWENKLSWLSLIYYSAICLEKLRKTTERLSEFSPCPGRNSNWKPLEHNPDTLSPKLTSSVPFEPK
jgi:hypothetical protein